MAAPPTEKFLASVSKIPVQFASSEESLAVFVVAFFDAWADSTTLMVTISPTRLAFTSEYGFTDVLSTHNDPSSGCRGDRMGAYSLANSWGVLAGFGDGMHPTRTTKIKLTQMIHFIFPQALMLGFLYRTSG
jgi:hypothetical protein